MNVLCIGNSFSQDASRYLHQIARADGVQIDVVNLYIGGCSLERHFRNLMADAKAYEFGINGHSSGMFVSIKDALLSRHWDVVTMQQVSQQSVDYKTYQPFLNTLSDYVRKYAPIARQALHQTWAYKPESERMTLTLGYPTHEQMYLDIRKAYEQAVEDMKPDLLIPSGALMNLLVKGGIEHTHRDQIHASLGIGRYALGLLWYKALTGNDVTGNSFRDFDVPVSEAEVSLAKECVAKVL